AGAAPEERPDVAELLPVDRFSSFLELAPAEAAVVLAGEEDVEPALADLWQDVTAAFHDDDARHLYVPPGDVVEALNERARLRLTGVLREGGEDGAPAFHAQSADTAARSLAE